MVCEIEAENFVDAENTWCQFINDEILSYDEDFLAMITEDDERDILRDSMIEDWNLFKSCADIDDRNARELLYENISNYARCKIA